MFLDNSLYKVISLLRSEMAERHMQGAIMTATSTSSTTLNNIPPSCIRNEAKNGPTSLLVKTLTRGPHRSVETKTHGCSFQLLIDFSQAGTVKRVT